MYILVMKFVFRTDAALLHCDLSSVLYVFFSTILIDIVEVCIAFNLLDIS